MSDKITVTGLVGKPPQVFRPTASFRWLKTPYEDFVRSLIDNKTYDLCLQQAWMSDDGTVEWIAVPVVEKEAT